MPSRSLRRFRSSFQPRLEGLEDRLLLAVFTVTNTNDSGPGSLRQAILDANGTAGLDTIAFNIGGGGVQTIRPMSALSAISDPAVIDGTTQPGFMGRPLIQLTGDAAGVAHGLELLAGGTTVRGLVINGFSQSGIEMRDGQGRNTIVGNYIGTDMTGMLSVGNYHGISIIRGSQNLIGGIDPRDRNLVSGNRSSGVYVEWFLNRIQGNYIGTDITGTGPLGNGLHGVSIHNPALGNLIGGTEAGAGNLIAANGGAGVFLDGNGNRVQGNRIGTDATGTQAMGNADGVSILDNGNLIGGSEAGATNLISGNRNNGVSIFDTVLNRIEGNRIGTDLTGATAIPNVRDGVFIERGVNTVIGGTAAGAGNLISGNRGAGVRISALSQVELEGNFIGTDARGVFRLANGGVGVEIDNSSTRIGGNISGARNLISGNASDGIRITGLITGVSLVRGNFIGTDVLGSRALPNGGFGISIEGRFHSIGGIAAGFRNLISGNGQGGIRISGSDNFVRGNFIGADVGGMFSLGNGAAGPAGLGSGVAILQGAGNTIGGTEAGARNLISGHAADGIYLDVTRENIVAGNFIGTDAAGVFPLANQRHGVNIAGGLNNTIGGTQLGARNLISGNMDSGVFLGTNNNRVLGNFLGTDVTGNRAIPNRRGVQVGVGASQNTIGGTTPASRNLLSGNAGDGVLLSGPNNLVQGNYIGTNVAGTAAIPNFNGVASTASDNVIGGIATGAGNLISGNALSGILIIGALAPALRNVVQGNLIGTDLMGNRGLGNGNFGVDVGIGASELLLGGAAAGAGNVISANESSGVRVRAPDVSILGNFIGTNAAGTAALGNVTFGLEVAADRTTIGGAAPGARNVISANRGGIWITSALNMVQGNYIGTDVMGRTALSNGTGLDVDGSSNLIGGTAPGAGNLISGNALRGMRIVGQEIRVEGNFIGTDVNGMVSLANGTGAVLGSPNSILGGTAAGAGNLISGNTEDGLHFLTIGGSRAQGNRIGTDISGIRALPNGRHGIFIEAPDNLIGANLISGNARDGVHVFTGVRNRIERNLIGTNAAGDTGLPNRHGVVLGSADNVVTANVIAGNRENGVHISGGNGSIVQGNFIGTDVTGTRALSNNTGVAIASGARNTTIGGADPGAGNLISANRGWGISTFGTSGRIQGNLIGTDITGTQALPNGTGGSVGGVFIGASDNTIGGTTPGAGNLISGNNGEGILVNTAVNTVIQGNLIGTDVTGTRALGNRLGGVELGGVPNTTVAGNLISGNGIDGILVTGNMNTIMGNLIGTDITGSRALGNGRMGIYLNGAHSNRVGGTLDGAGNLISGNGDHGILVGGSGNNIIQGNVIGIDVTGAALPNAGSGIFIISGIFQATGNQIGGAANLIAFNRGDGVRVDRGTENPIRRNAIFGHDAGLGIRLVNGGNRNQAAPQLTSVVVSGAFLTIEGTLTSAPNTIFSVEFFANNVCNPSGFGEGEQFFASLAVTTNAKGRASFSVTVPLALAPGQFVTSTATDPAGNTSQFSACAEVEAGASPGGRLTGLSTGLDLLAAARPAAAGVEHSNAHRVFKGWHKEAEMQGTQSEGPMSQSQNSTQLSASAFDRFDFDSANPLIETQVDTAAAIALEWCRLAELSLR